MTRRVLHLDRRKVDEAPADELVRAIVDADLVVVWPDGPEAPEEAPSNAPRDPRK